MSIAPAPDRRLTGLAAAAVALAAAATFLGTLDAQLLNFDDDVYITANPLVQDRSWRSTGRLLTRRQLGVYNPLPLLAFSAAYSLWGDHPAGYHALNLVFHSANAVLVFALALALTRRRFVAFACALLWAVHPLRVESVAWASQFKEMLGAFFYLAALLLYLGRGRSRLAFPLAVAAFVCSVLCKPIYVTLPAVVLLLDLYVERRLTRASFVRVLPFAAVSLAWMVVSLVLVWEAKEWISVQPPAARIARAGYLLAYYPRRLLWPGRLAVTYPTPSLSLGSAEFLLSALGLLAALGVCVRLYRRTALPLFALGFYAVVISPTLGFFSYPGAKCSDRYAYLASIGIALLAAAAFDLVARRGRVRAAFAYVLVVALAAPMAVRSAVRAEVWHDSLTLWTTELAATPDSLLVRNNLGGTYKDRGQYDAALVHLSAAVTLAPDKAEPRANIAHIHFLRSEFAEAARWYRTAAERAPRRRPLWINLGRTELLSGNPQGAVSALRQAVALDVHDCATLALLGKGLNAAGQTDEAVRAYERALALEPGLYFVHAALGDIYANKLKDAAAAARHYRRALELSPEDDKDTEELRRRLRALGPPSTE